MEHVVVLEGLILDNCHFGKVWSFHKDWWFFTISPWKCGILKRLIMDNLNFGRIWWSCKDWFSLWTCVVLLKGLTWIIPLWEGVVVLKELLFQFLLWEGDAVLKGLIFNYFLFKRMWLSCVVRFGKVSLWEDVVVLKGLILYDFNLGRMGWSWKEWFWTVATLRMYDHLERSHFQQFPYWDDVVVLKRWFWIVCTLRGCGGLEWTGVFTFSILRVCAELERTEFL